MVVPFTAIVNTSKGSGGGKEGQLMSSVLLVMESELLSDKPVKKKIVAIKICLLKHYFEQEKQGKVMKMFNEVNH